MHLPQELVMVPESVVRHSPKLSELCEVSEDIDNKDYIYDVARTRGAEGKKYVAYRNALSYFKRNYGPNIVARPIALGDHSVSVRIINSLHTWDNTYRQTDQARMEGLAINQLLRNARDLNVQCLVVEIDNRLASFCFYHYPPQQGYVIVNHLKCDNRYKYIFDYTFARLIELLHAQGITYANLEQDLGIPGLRTHKQRLAPIDYLRRYTVRPRQE
jgi:hypothetical protein